MSKLKLHVVFVDDDEFITSSLKRGLRSLKDIWEINFFNDSLNAFEFIQENPCDVVVTDMLMPNLDGSKLLAKVYECKPQTIRMILSGQADKELLYRASLFSHAFMAKPFSSETVIKAIEKATRLRQSFMNSALINSLTQQQALPSPPMLYHRLLALLNDDKSTIDSITHLVEQDVSVSSKLLQIINSAYFGLSREIISVSEAIRLLGVDTIRSLFFTITLFKQYKGAGGETSLIDNIYQYSLSISHLSTLIAQRHRLDLEAANVCKTAGLLSQIGLLVLADRFPKELDQLKKMVQNEKIDIYNAEELLLHRSHCVIGAYLMSIWGLPDEIVEAILYSYSPTELIHDPAIVPISVVHLATWLAAQKHPAFYNKYIQVDEPYLHACGFESAEFYLDLIA